MGPLHDYGMKHRGGRHRDAVPTAVVTAVSLALHPGLWTAFTGGPLALHPGLWTAFTGVPLALHPGLWSAALSGLFRCSLNFELIL